MNASRLAAASFFAIVALFAVLPLSAAEPANKATKGAKYALLIGIHEYDKNELRVLRYAEADVTDLAAALADTGYAKENIVLLTPARGAASARDLPTIANIRRELALFADCEKDDEVLIALVGHSVQFKNGDETFFCPLDAKLTDRKTLLPFKEFYADLEKCKAHFKLLLADVSRGDPRSDAARARGGVDVEADAQPQKVSPPKGTAAFFSCRAGESAYEHPDLKHGIFFHFVIEGLRGKAAPLESSQVTLPSLEKFVKRKTADFAHDFGVEQTPQLVGKTDSAISLVRLDPSRFKPVAKEKPGDTITNSIGMKLAYIPAGEFMMGNDEPDDVLLKEFRYATKSWLAQSAPAHRVRITKPFYLGVYHVTKAEFAKFVKAEGFKTLCELNGHGAQVYTSTSNRPEQDSKCNWRNPGFDDGDDHPVVCVNWDDACAFCEWLSKKEKRDYRLPTEAEWEYACRAGTRTRYYNGNDPEKLAEIGNTQDAGFKAKIPWGRHPIKANDGYAFTSPVGKFKPNAWGLYDMHGNAMQWCADCFEPEYYAHSPVDDPLCRIPSKPPESGVERRVTRGGAWANNAMACRDADRGCMFHLVSENIYGFRVACSVLPDSER